MGYNMFKSQYQEPTLAEGFCEILKIPFHPKFESVEHENLFKQWTAWDLNPSAHILFLSIQTTIIRLYFARFFFNNFILINIYFTDISN